MSDLTRLAQATVKGAVWSYAAFVAGKGLIFISTIILARILAPADFGLLALGLIAINYLDRLSDFGVSAALIYRQQDSERAANVAFVFSLVTGALLTVCAWLAAPLMAAFFQEPRVIPITQALSVTFMITSLGNIHEALLKKNLDFRGRFVPETGKSIFKGTVSIVLAWMGFGVWSLVWGQIAGALAATVLYWWITRWRPQLTFDRRIARAMLGYGVQIMLLDVLGGIHSNVDALIVGRRLNVGALGFYSMGFRIPELVILNICVVVSRALFPAYAKIQNDLAALRSGYLATLRYIALITVPAGIGMVIIAPEFVNVFYTERWAPAIPVMQALAVYAVIYSLSFNAGDIYKAIGRPALLNQTALFNLLLNVPLLLVAVNYGIFYVAVGQAFSILVLTLVRLGIVSRLLSIRPSAFLESLKPAANSAIVMLLGAWGLRVLIVQFDPAARLVALTLAGAILYVSTLWVADRTVLQQLIALVRTPSRSAPLANESGQ